MLSSRLRRLLTVAVILAVAAVAAQQVAAQRLARPAAQASPLHPAFALLDAAGRPVLETGRPLSTMQTCGQCHDTPYIEQHNFHADQGLSGYGPAGAGRPWDNSPGPFGQWNPLTYRYLSPAGDERLDLGTADWVRLFGDRHAGGGPAVTARDGTPLAALVPDLANPETTVLDPASGQPVLWDWQQSGTVELNCFLCHLSRPNNAARVQALRDGQFAWAGTATLLGTGIVEQTGLGWQWNPAAFDASGALAPEFVTLQDPGNANCAQCHGLVHAAGEEPPAIAACDLENWETATTGQVISPDKIASSGLNLAGKAGLTRAWDVHAERGLQCTDCHFSLNNPAQYPGTPPSGPEHLVFDPRRLELGEYLQRPDHQLARGANASSAVVSAANGALLNCEGCHDASAAHEGFPYLDRHLSVLACETCHIPQVYAPAIQHYDWTVLTPDSGPRQACRGVHGDTGTPADLVTGYQPVLLPRPGADGTTWLAPYNLITAWYWVYDAAPGSSRPVRLADLQAAWLAGGQYAPEVVAVLDAGGDGQLAPDELVLDTPAKQAAIAGRLEALGLDNPRIAGEVQPYRLNHTVTRGEWAIGDCQACHGEASRLAQPIKLADYVPGSMLPAFVTEAGTEAPGELYTEAGALYYRPATAAQSLYVFGHDRVVWVDGLGLAAFLGVMVAVAAHGTLRFLAALRLPHARTPRRQRVYMYAVYERFWHWLQTFAILLLILTGLIIHRPDLFGLFSFRHVVVVHNVLAAILVINAGLSLFYHLASGEIRQFIPRPYGFFDQAIVQARFYLRGIFQGEPHPFAKTPHTKLNPLQQLTYLGILNVLLPLQVITGALMWGVQHWPQWAGLFGGLPVLAPLHSLVAWLFAAFIVAHVYLTTTGHQPLAGLNAMINGWEDVDEPLTSAEERLEHEHTDTDSGRPRPSVGPEGAAV